MIFSLNCLFLGEASVRSISVDISDEIIVGINRIEYEVSHVKSLILSEKGVSYSPDNLNLWKVDRDSVIKNDDFKDKKSKSAIHIIVQAPTTATTLVAVLSSQQPISPFRRVFDHKFYDREQAINQIAMIANMNYTNRLLTYHRSHYFILVPGGSGIGKSRVGMETQHLISYAEESALMNIGRINLVKDSLNDPCYIFINFNDGCKYLQKLDKMRVRIGARIAVASGIALTS
uniref:Crinkler effector protein N-terminal domain-containing protein n=1 Tax=Rhizophagus irregularis (strain DAOM 181602 / DAOM 197198 / MUCL 43194) TaxID=747089 RepID=U9UFK6_RHIID